MGAEVSDTGEVAIFVPRPSTSHPAALPVVKYGIGGGIWLKGGLGTLVATADFEKPSSLNVEQPHLSVELRLNAKAVGMHDLGFSVDLLNGGATVKLLSASSARTCAPAAGGTLLLSPTLSGSNFRVRFIALL